MTADNFATNIVNVGSGAKWVTFDHMTIQNTSQAATKSCSKEAKAKGLKGDARTKFVKECKDGKHPA